MIGVYAKYGRGAEIPSGDFLFVAVASGEYRRNGQTLRKDMGALWSVKEGDAIGSLPEEGLVLSFSERQILRAFAEQGIRPDADGVLMESSDWTRVAELFFGETATLDHVGRATAFVSLILSYRREETSADRVGESYVRFVEEYVREHLSESIQVDALAEELGISRGYLRNVFFASHGMSPREYLTEERLRAAKDYLREGTHSVAETARLVGYEDALQFSRIFKKHTGSSPSGFCKAGGVTVARSVAVAEPISEPPKAEPPREERPIRRQKDPVWLF